jgi:hypothetical protein
MQLNFGEDIIDFQIQIIPTADRFALIFIPFAMLQQEGNVFRNPVTGVTNSSINVPEHLHMGNAAGRWSATPEQIAIWSQSGKEYLQRLYDYTALSGARAFMISFVKRFEQSKNHDVLNPRQSLLSG